MLEVACPFCLFFLGLAHVGGPLRGQPSNPIRYKGPSWKAEEKSGIDGKQLLNDGLHLICMLLKRRKMLGDGNDKEGKQIAMKMLSAWKAKREGKDESEWKEALAQCPKWLVPDLMAHLATGVTGPSANLSVLGNFKFSPDNGTSHQDAQFCRMV